MLRALVLVLALAAPAAAETDAIAVLPLVASGQDRDLDLYTTAVASALAAELRRTGRPRVLTPATAAAVSEEVGLVVHGRIVARGEEVQLEARVRDPARGKTSATVATRSAPLTRIDELAGELARALQPVLARAEEARRAPIRLPEIVVHTEADRRSAAASAPDDRPAVLVVRARGRVAAGIVDVAGPATASARAGVARLGGRPVASGATAPALAPHELAAVLTASGAEHALVLEVRRVDFSWNGVLSARGEVHIALVDAAGATVINRMVTTGTLVGDRGDRHAALVHFVVEQAMDIAGPELRRALEP